MNSTFDLDKDSLVKDSASFGQLSSGAKLYHGSFARGSDSKEATTVCLQEEIVGKEGCKRKLADVAREVTLLKRFSEMHRNIVSIEGASHDPDTGRTLIAMCCKGPSTLRGAILEFSFPWDLRMHLCQDIAAALDAIHGANMLHRNISPSAILVDNKWHAYVCGFSDAITENEAQSSTSGKEEVSDGVPHRLMDAFKSPEFANLKPHSRATDVFSFGALMYSLVTFDCPESIPEDEALQVVDLQHDQSPFGGAHRTRKNNFDINEENVAANLEDGCPAEFRELILRCCTQSAAARPTINDVLTSLVSLSIIAPPTTQSKTSKKSTKVMAPSRNEPLPVVDSVAAPVPKVDASGSEAIELKAIVADLRMEMKRLREDNERLRQIVENKEREGLNIFSRIKPEQPESPPKAPVPTAVTGAVPVDRSVQSVLESFLKVVETCDATPLEDASIAPPRVPPPQPSVPSSPNKTSKWLQSMSSTTNSAADSPTKARGQLNVSELSATPSSSNRRYRSKPSSPGTAKTFLQQSRSVARTPTKFSKVPINQRRLHPDQDPRTPPRRGPGSRPSQGEYFRSVGSSGSPHILNTDSKLARNWFRADDANLNRERFQEYHTDKNHKHIKNNIFLAGATGPDQRYPNHGILQADMQVTANMLHKK